MTTSWINQLRFYNGRDHSIDKKRLAEFETRAIINRYYAGEEIDVATLIEDLGPINLDFTNIHPWSEKIPDIDKRSARLFTIWAEDEETKDIAIILRGFYVVLSFKWGKSQLIDYFGLTENVPYFPMAVISALRTVVYDNLQLTALLDRTKVAIEDNWRELRQQTLNHLEKNDELWKRYVFCFDKIIHFSFLCSCMDRELIDSLRKEGYRTTDHQQENMIR
ncbi:MAG: hypothetical protein ACXADY_21805 [Candidatus Hodarchaeales archaeon]